MAEITVTLTILKTVSEVNGTVFQTVQDWVETNVADNLPSDASLKAEYRVKP